MGNGGIRGTYRGVPDNESGSHTQGYLLTQRMHVLGRGVHKAKNIDMAFVSSSLQYPVGEVTALQ